MKIQVVTFDGRGSFEGCEITSLSNPLSFNNFELNFIMLNNSSIYQGNAHKENTIRSQNDLITLSSMIDRATTPVVVVLPQNYQHSYKHYDLIIKKPLKDHPALNNWIALISPFQFKLQYDKTTNNIEDLEVSSDFIFEDFPDINKTFPGKNQLPTVLCFGTKIFTTLNLTNEKEIMAFRNHLWPTEQTEKIPEWLSEINVLDDESQRLIIEDSQMKISKEQDTIDRAKSVLDKNNRIKAILSWANQDLVDVVREIIEEILDVDLSGFEDEMKEDLSFEIDGINFLCEIKGISTNIKKVNVSQLDNHVQDFYDINPGKAAKGLLIINHQRNKPLDQRESVHPEVISLAERNESLVIETRTLLSLLESFRNKNLTKYDFIDLIKNKIGLLEWVSAT